MAYFTCITGCFDPSQSIISLFDIPLRDNAPSSDEPSGNNYPSDQSSSGEIARFAQLLSGLPTELFRMILEMLPPSHLIGIVVSGDGAFNRVAPLCHTMPQFYYYSDDRFFDPVKWKSGMHKIRNTWKKRHYARLDKRWELILDVSRRLKIARWLPEGTLPASTVDPLDLSMTRDCLYGFQETFVQIHRYLRAMTVFQVFHDGYPYVCGLELKTEARVDFVGQRSSSSYTMEVHEVDTGTLRFITNPLGVCALKFGDSAWPPLYFDPSTCWEGVSRISNPSLPIRIIQDACSLLYVDDFY